MKLYPTILSGFLLTGCMVSYGSYYQPQVLQVSPQEIALKSEITKSEFDKCTEVVGAEVISNPEYFSMENTSYATTLRSWLCDSTKKHQLYVTIEYTGSWRFYGSASDKNANTVPLLKISQDVLECKNFGCKYSETLGINLTDADLNKGTKEGFKYQIRAKSGDKTIIEVPANVVQGYIQSLAGQD